MSCGLPPVHGRQVSRGELPSRRFVQDEAFWANTLGGMPASRIRKRLLKPGWNPWFTGRLQKGLREHYKLG